MKYSLRAAAMWLNLQGTAQFVICITFMLVDEWAGLITKPFALGAPVRAFERLVAPPLGQHPALLIAQVNDIVLGPDLPDRHGFTLL